MRKHYQLSINNMPEETPVEAVEVVETPVEEVVAPEVVEAPVEVAAE